MSPTVDDLTLALAIVGLTLVSVVNRSFFFLSRRPLPLPPALLGGLRYAPLGALIAVVVPEVIRPAALAASGLRDARLWSALVATAYTRLRPRDMLGTIVLGMGAYVALHLGLGW
jgi:branched-subunit amino acid transport protein